MLEAIPKYWYVLYNSEEEYNIITKYFNLNWTYIGNFNNCGYTNIPSSFNNWVQLDGNCINRTFLEKRNAVEISFDDFVYYIVTGNKFIKRKSLNYLKLLLKKLNIQ